MRSEHHDVIVIGAGAAGVTAAGALCAAGRRVLLIDRDAAALAPTATTPTPLYRLRREDLGRLEHFEGDSPAWPIDGEELARWYAFAEQACAVRGRRGADPTEPPAGRPLPATPEPSDPSIQAAMHRLRAAGLHPFPTPVGVAPSGAPAGCDVMVGTAVCIETDATGAEARAVIVEREGGRRARYTGDVFVLAAGAVGSAALLLRSASDRNPAGLANASGVVGRNLVRRSFGLMLALMKREPPASIDPGFTLHDFYLRSPGWRYPGGHVRLIGSTHRQIGEPGSPWPGPYGTRSVHSLDFLLAAEGLPDPGNRVDVGRSGEIAVHYRPNNLVALRKLSAQMRHVLNAIGSPTVHAPLSLHPDAASQLRGASGSGTVRMGTDPARSAVRADGRAHEVENLWVTDASTWNAGGALEPTLTQVAFALRTADLVHAALGARVREESGVAATKGGRAA